MKTIKKERTFYDTYYKACDGTQFQNKEECEKYEQTARCVLNTKFRKLIVEEGNEYKFFHAGCEDSVVYAVKVKTEADKDTIMQLYLLDNSWAIDSENGKDYIEKAYDKVNAALQEKELLLVGVGCEDEIYIINTRSHIINNLLNIGKKNEATDTNK